MTEKENYAGYELENAIFNVQNNVGSIVKDSENTHFKWKYADYKTTMEAIAPYLKNEKLKVDFTFPPIWRKGTSPNGASSEEVDLRIIHVVSTVIHVPTGQSKTYEMTVPIAKPDAQGMGSAQTYGKRYAMNGIFNLTTEDDDGHATTEEASNKRARTFAETPEKFIEETETKKTDTPVTPEPSKTPENRPRRAANMANAPTIEEPPLPPKKTEEKSKSNLDLSGISDEELAKMAEEVEEAFPEKSEKVKAAELVDSLNMNKRQRKTADAAPAKPAAEPSGTTPEEYSEETFQPPVKKAGRGNVI